VSPQVQILNVLEEKSICREFFFPADLIDKWEYRHPHVCIFSHRPKLDCHEIHPILLLLLLVVDVKIQGWPSLVIHEGPLAHVLVFSVLEIIVLPSWSLIEVVFLAINPKVSVSKSEYVEDVSHEDIFRLNRGLLGGDRHGIWMLSHSMMHFVEISELSDDVEIQEFLFQGADDKPREIFEASRQPILLVSQ
jgi:hypothetical protein